MRARNAHGIMPLDVATDSPSSSPIGFAVVTLVDGAAHLHELAVLPDHGGRGGGRALVHHVVNWSSASDFESLSLTTFRHLPWNGPFYANVGFVEIGAPDLGPELRATLSEEIAKGIDPRKRIAMRLDLTGA